jgi:hypothetical protein
MCIASMYIQDMYTVFMYIYNMRNLSICIFRLCILCIYDIYILPLYIFRMCVLSLCIFRLCILYIYI